MLSGAVHRRVRRLRVESSDGSFQTGVFRRELSDGGVFRRGLFSDGSFQTGVFRREFLDGSFQTGVFRREFSTGVFRREFSDGSFRTGVFRRGFSVADGGFLLLTFLNAVSECVAPVSPTLRTHARTHAHTHTHTHTHVRSEPAIRQESSIALAPSPPSMCTHTHTHTKKKKRGSTQCVQNLSLQTQ